MRAGGREGEKGRRELGLPFYQRIKE